MRLGLLKKLHEMLSTILKTAYLYNYYITRIYLLKNYIIKKPFFPVNCHYSKGF
jgi:hypothetical protein